MKPETGSNRIDQRITKRRLDAALRKRRPGGILLYDSGIRGFGAKVLPSGVVTFFLRYGGRQGRRFFTLGRLGEEMNVEAARRAAERVLGDIRDGKDPVLDREREREIPTFTKWAEKYLKQTERERKEPYQPKHYLAVASKKWGRRSLNQIMRSDVLKARSEIADEAARSAFEFREKTGRPHDGHEHDGSPTANRFVAHLAACFEAARKQGLISSNPCAGIKQLRENPPRARVLSDAEMGRLIEALEKEDRFTSAAFHVLIETGCRSSEILRAKWEDFDLDAGIWRLPSPKAGRVQKLPLAAITVERLDALPRLSEWVIPGVEENKRRYDLKSAWRRITGKAKIVGATTHDIRRTFGLRVARTAGVRLASRLLRHADLKTTVETYTPDDMDVQRAAVEGVARLLPFPASKRAS